MSIQKVNLTSSSLSKEKIEELYRILPDAFSESKVDFNKLRAILGDDVAVGSEKFYFSWVGKSNAIKNVLVPSRLTLNPKPEESIKFDSSENLFIEGDNLEVLKLLQKAYFEKVKMIYIDPPYNTGHDFVYNDDFSSPLDNYLRQTGQKNGDGDSTTTNKETNGRYHSDWLSMMYPRLKLAWNLLREDGVIFVSIDDNEVHHLRMIMDEIFGEENFLTTFIWKKKGTSTNVEGATVSALTEYVVAYEKSEPGLNLRITPKEERIYPFEDSEGVYRKAVIEKKNAGSYQRATMQFEIIGHKPRQGKRWQVGEETARKLEKMNRFVYENEIIKLKIYDFEDNDSYSANPNLFLEMGSSQSAAKMVNDTLFGISELFDNPKPIELIQKLVQLTTKSDENNLVLDFFAGSGTTAHAVLKQNQEDKGNRKFICVQLPEKLDKDSEGYKARYKTIADISKERIKRVIKGYGDNPQPIDAGFKVFTLSPSNYPENKFVFDPSKPQKEQQKEFIAYLHKAKQNELFDKENDTSIVYENIVKEGLSLNSVVAKVSVGKNTMYQVTDGQQQLLICLEDKLAPDTVKELTDKSRKDKLFICLESSLDDTTAANLALNLDLKTI